MTLQDCRAERLVYTQAVAVVLHDISRDGRVLLTNYEWRTKLMLRRSGESGEREISWLDWSFLNNISPDGKLVSFFEFGEGAGATPLSYLREGCVREARDGVADIVAVQALAVNRGAGAWSTLPRHVAQEACDANPVLRAATASCARV
jgi:hypothetical protein